jgi:hypothetical protein
MKSPATGRLSILLDRLQQDLAKTELDWLGQRSGACLRVDEESLRVIGGVNLMSTPSTLGQVAGQELAK